MLDGPVGRGGRGEAGGTSHSKMSVLLLIAPLVSKHNQCTGRVPVTGLILPVTGLMIHVAGIMLLFFLYTDLNFYLSFS
jgi:hypothetical protein